WMIATVNAPIFLLYRSWSVAFLQRLDPDFRGWSGGGEPDAAPPPEEPPTGPAPSGDSSWLESGPSRPEGPPATGEPPPEDFS
ncbi:MAG: hypothetical protein OEQ13_02940, partial [Acidobacteriota bacterium]|nr:hypothetical protein [Acidobacteriota bacterium]